MCNLAKAISKQDVAIKNHSSFIHAKYHINLLIDGTQDIVGIQIKNQVQDSQLTRTDTGWHITEQARDYHTKNLIVQINKCSHK